ncbi:hypothetical protein L7F22_012757 [Adiantum nelumboides]|nr:hypothetical protein [Adiantum nelumboides]
MKQFLSSDAKDKVLTEWRSLKLTPYESIQKYVDKFWDLHLKATVYRKIDFEEQKQQFCASLPEDMNEYVNSRRPKTISAVIHHTMVATKINFQQGAKRNLKPMEIKEKHEHKGKNQPPNSSKGNSSNNKSKEKGVYKGKNRLTPEELERYRKDNRCFKCGEQGHAYQACPQRNARNEQPRASIIETPKEDAHCKGSPLSYAWGKVREHDAFILFDPGSTHNFISHELATKLGIQDFEMGDAMKTDGAFIGQDASVTPLIGKLRLHIQGYVDKEDFFISPLKHEDVILGAPWFDRLAASIKFPERRISFKFREKNMYIDAQESGNTIPLVSGKRVGIVGLGRIGMAIAKRAEAFGCPIAYQGRSAKSGIPYKFYSALTELAVNSDVLMISCPLSEETKGSINREVLDALGPDGFLINIARGPIVDEGELVKALVEGRIGGAGLDVFENEPQVPQELITLDNVVLTPHVGSLTWETRRDMADLVVSNLEAHFSGKPLLTPV